MLKAIVLVCLISFAFLGINSQAKEKTQCEIKYNIEPEDWKRLNANITKPSEKMLCLFKCVYEENGSTNSDGTINVEKMIENVHKWKRLTDDSKNFIRYCLKDLGPVKTCADVIPSLQCAHRAVKAQETLGVILKLLKRADEEM